MKYYKVEIQSNFPRVGKIADRVEGTNISNADCFFEKIGNGEVLINAPIFDYFHLESYDKKENWEWKLFDVYKFFGTASYISMCWLVSEKLKKILELLILPQPYCFYQSKLLYRKEKIDYYIFQFTGNLIYEQTLLYIDFNKSIFTNPVKNDEIKVCDKSAFLSKYDKIYNENNSLSKIIQFKKLGFIENLDFFPIGILMKDNIVSGRLKNIIEENNIEGFEFSELDYEVIVEK